MQFWKYSEALKSEKLQTWLLYVLWDFNISECVINFLQVQEVSLCSVIYQHFLFFTYICIFPYNQIVNTNETSQVILKTSNKLSGYLLKNYFVFIQASEGIENEQRSTEIAECLERSDWN